MSRGFIQIRTGLSEHLLNSALGAFAAGVYLIILLQVDFETGVWTGSAPRLLASAPRGASLRDMQRALELLEKIGFIRIFHRNGVRGNYRVLVNKYEPQFGALKGKRLNAAKSDGWKNPAYEVCAVPVALDDTDTGALPVAVSAPYPYSDTHKDSKKHKPAPSAPGVSESLIAIWNSNRGNLPEVLKLTEGRRKKILSRIRYDAQFPNKFETATKKAAAAPFCNGTGGGWTVTFDWLIKDGTNYVKVLEGNYDNRNGNGSHGANRKPSGAIGAEPDKYADRKADLTVTN